MVSSSELLRRERGALGEGFELGLGELGVDAAAQAAVGAGDHALAADQAREAADALGDQVGDST